MSLINGTSTSAFLYCTSPPATQTFYTTVYETVLPAACETSQWIATYTITETCAGNPADYVTAVVPPGFVVTTVSCAGEPAEEPSTASGVAAEEALHAASIISPAPSITPLAVRRQSPRDFIRVTLRSLRCYCNQFAKTISSQCRRDVGTHLAP